MSGEANKKLVRRYYEDVVGNGQIEELSKFIDGDYVEVHEGRRYDLGLEGAKEHVLGVRRTYLDLQITVDRQIAEGEWVVSCITMRGIHAGEWLGIAPTGKPVTMTAVNVDRVRDGLIVEHGGAANMLMPLLEVGAVKVTKRSEA